MMPTMAVLPVGTTHDSPMNAADKAAPGPPSVLAARPRDAASLADRVFYPIVLILGIILWWASR
jgi:hypothetical protein